MMLGGDGLNSLVILLIYWTVYWTFYVLCLYSMWFICVLGRLLAFYLCCLVGSQHVWGLVR